MASRSLFLNEVYFGSLLTVSQFVTYSLCYGYCSSGNIATNICSVMLCYFRKEVLHVMFIDSYIPVFDRVIVNTC